VLVLLFVMKDNCCVWFFDECVGSLIDIQIGWGHARRLEAGRVQRKPVLV